MKIRQKLLISVLASVMLVFAGLTLLSFMSSRRALVTEIKRRAEAMLKSHTWELEARLMSVESVAQGIAVAIESLKPEDEEELKGYILRAIESENGIYGSTISFEPGSFPGDKRLVGPYYHRSKNELVYVDLATPSYDYPKWDWYKIPRDTKRPIWTEPYIDTGGGDVPMTTYACPFFREGKVWGVATIDIALKDLTADIEATKVGETGFAFLLSREGKFLTMRQNEWSLQKTISDVADEYKSDRLKRLGEEMIAGRTGFISMINPLSGKQAWFVYGPVAATGWSLAIVFPENELLDQLNTLHRNMFIIAGAGAALIFGLLFIISSRITKPIGLLAESARKISNGDFAAEPAGSTGADELGVLTRAFKDMRRSLLATLESLREEKEMFRACFAGMSDGIVILDVNLNPLQFNQSAERLLMLPSQGPFSEHLMAHFDSSVPLEKMKDFSHAMPVFELTRRETEKLGKLCLLSLVTPVVDDKGAVRLFVMAVRDITSMKSEELSKQNFLSTISHKLNTPVSVLQSSVSLLHDGLLGELTEKQRRHVESMAKNVAKLLGLIDELVGFVTIEGAALDMSREKIELNDFYAGLADAAKRAYAEKHPEIIVHMKHEACEIEFNRKYLHLIFSPLIDNALKFNLSDPAIVDIEYKREGDFAAISVKDNGVGIPPEYLDRIFDKFYQIEKYFTGNVDGVGLGLSFAKKIVDSFGGTIDVHSTPGEGSVFTVKLPIV